MFRLIMRMFDDIHRLANCASFPRSLDVVVELSQEDRELLANYRRYAPRVKKETKDNMHSANNLLGRTEGL